MAEILSACFFLICVELIMLAIYAIYAMFGTNADSLLLSSNALAHLLLSTAILLNARLSYHVMRVSHRRFDGNLSQENDSDNKATVKMDIRKLSAVLNHTTLSLSSASFCKYKPYVPLFSVVLLTEVCAYFDVEYFLFRTTLL